MAKSNRIAVQSLPVPEEMSSIQAMGNGLSHSFQAVGQAAEFSHRSLWTLNQYAKGVQVQVLLDQEDEYSERIESSRPEVQSMIRVIRGY
tara:strand:+ start:261 stop:530 length:270 start_codon:yes stop_codon:yes gene_type:complete